MSVLQTGYRAYHARVGGLRHRLVDRVLQGDLCLPHRRTLRIGGCEVLALRDWLDLQDLASHVVDHGFERFAVLRGVYRKLELALFDLKFSRNRLARRFTGGQGLPRADLSIAQAPDQR